MVLFSKNKENRMSWKNFMFKHAYNFGSDKKPVSVDPSKWNLPKYLTLEFVMKNNSGHFLYQGYKLRETLKEYIITSNDWINKNKAANPFKYVIQKHDVSYYWEGMQISMEEQRKQRDAR